MDNEEKYEKLLDYLIQFHERTDHGTEITIRKLPTKTIINNNGDICVYYLTVLYAYVTPGTSIANFYKLSYSARSLKDMYTNFLDFHADTHFFREDITLEEVELQLAIRNLNG